MNQAAAKNCLTENVRACLLHAHTRSHLYRGTFGAEPVQNLRDGDQWKLLTKEIKPLVVKDKFSIGSSFVGFADDDDDDEEEEDVDEDELMKDSLHD